MLLNNCKNGAASICDGLIVGNEKGWFLPTSEEINKIIENSSFLNMVIAPGKYWTNVDANINDAFILNIQNMGKVIYTLTTQKKYFPGIILPVKYFQKPVPVILQPEISSLHCAESKLIGSFPVGVVIKENNKLFLKNNEDNLQNLMIEVPYKGGNGVDYNSVSYMSDNSLSNLQLTLKGGKLNSGDGKLVFSLTGNTPDVGEIKFNINFAGQQGDLTLIIDHKIWDNKDLDVETFRNGDSIYFAYKMSDWVQAAQEKKPAWGYVYNSGLKYKVYNYIAVNDPRGLAPQGWHIATEEEWMNLIECMGGSNNYDTTVLCNSLRKLKTDKYWYDDNKGNNLSGFGAIPNGEWNPNGVFVSGDFGSWWTSSNCKIDGLNYGISVFMDLNYTFYSECAAKSKSTMYPDSNISNANLMGRSVRCIKD